MPGPRYKWVILVLAFFMMFFLSAVEYLVPYVSGPMMKDLKLTYTQSGLIFGTLFLGLIFCGPMGGIIVDRFGVRKSVGISTAIEGLFALLRGFSTGFYDLFLYSLIVSICTVIQVAGVGRSTSEWFEPSELGRVNGFWNVGFCLGALVVSATTVTIALPALDGWRGAFVFFGALDLVFGLFYILLAKDKVKPIQTTVGSVSSEVHEKPSRYGGLASLVKIKDIWLLFAIFAVITGSENAAINWIPQLLGNRGISTSIIGATGVIIWVGAITGNFFFPALSDHLGRRKPIMLGSIPILALSLYLSVISSSAGLSLAAGFFLGFSSSYFYPMIITCVCQVPEVYRNGFIGSATGLMISANGLGTFLLPTMGGYLRDASGSFSSGFALYIVCALLALPAIALLRESGTRAPATKIRSDA